MKLKSKKSTEYSILIFKGNSDNNHYLSESLWLGFVILNTLTMLDQLGEFHISCLCEKTKAQDLYISYKSPRDYISNGLICKICCESILSFAEYHSELNGFRNLPFFLFLY